MVLKLLGEKARRRTPCGYELYREGRLTHCGRPPVATAGKIMLCAEHAEYALLTAGATCRDEKDNPKAAKEFLELLKSK
jgi:hypothetical protein